MSQHITIPDHDIQLIIHHTHTAHSPHIITVVEVHIALHTAIQVAVDILVTVHRVILLVEVSTQEEEHHLAAHQEVPVQEDTKAIQLDRFFNYLLLQTASLLYQVSGSHHSFQLL